MKRLSAIILSVVMALSVCACGGGAKPAETTAAAEETTAAGETKEAVSEKLSKEELLNTVGDVITTMGTIAGDTVDNKAKAKLTYCDKIFLVRGFVVDIETDYIVLADSAYLGIPQLKVYLPLEEIVELENREEIDVIGHITNDIESESTSDTFGGNFTSDIYTMDYAYFVNDRFEISGKLFGMNQSYAPAFNFMVPATSNTARLLYFADDVDPAEYGFDAFSRDEITVLTKVYMKESYDYEYKEAVPLEAPAKEDSIEDRIKRFSSEDREFFNEYAKNLIPMSEDEIISFLKGHSFKMRNNYGGDGDGVHTITFFEDGTLDANYKASNDNETYSMFESWKIENGTVILTHTFIDTKGKEKTTDYSFNVYKYDDTRYFMINETYNDGSMVLTVSE